MSKVPIEDNELKCLCLIKYPGNVYISHWAPAKDLVIQGNRMVQLAGSDLLTMGRAEPKETLRLNSFIFNERRRLFI